MKWMVFPALAVVGLSAVGCAEGIQLGATTQSTPVYEAHPAAPDAIEVAAKPCKYGDTARCIEQCQNGDPKACNAMGVIFEYGRFAPPDSAIASGFYQHACDANYAPGCTNLAWLYSLGHGVPHDTQQAMALFTRAFDASRLACRRGDGHGCLMAGQFMLRGDITPKDEDGALAYFKLACDQGEREGCDLVETLR
jgi:TPR repeat protein